MEFEIPGEIETITASTQYNPPQLGTVFNPSISSTVVTTTIRKQICPHCLQLDFHEIKEETKQ
jgi:hypothetical protein